MRSRIQKLIDLINSLSNSEKEVFATACETSIGNLRQIAYGHGFCSPAKAQAISKASQYSVTPHDIRPDLYPNPTDALPVNLTTNFDVENVQVGAA